MEGQIRKRYGVKGGDRTRKRRRMEGQIIKRHGEKGGDKTRKKGKNEGTNNKQSSIIVS